MYYIYHVKGVKIGVSQNPERRVRRQGYSDFEILEKHTDIIKVSERERELQKQYGYKVDWTPYYETYKLAKSGIGGQGNKGSKKPWVAQSNKPKRKLTYDDAQQIRAEYRLGSITQRQLAKMYNVSQRTIVVILNNKTYVTP